MIKCIYSCTIYGPLLTQIPFHWVGVGGAGEPGTYICIWHIYTYMYYDCIMYIYIYTYIIYSIYDITVYHIQIYIYIQNIHSVYLYMFVYMCIYIYTNIHVYVRIYIIYVCVCPGKRSPSPLSTFSSACVGSRFHGNTPGNNSVTEEAKQW